VTGTTILYLKSVGVAVVLFATIGVTLWMFWFQLLVVTFSDVWKSLPNRWPAILGVTLLLFAIISGLVIYYFVLALMLQWWPGVSAAESSRYALRAAAVPIGAAVMAIYYVITHLRIGI